MISFAVQKLLSLIRSHLFIFAFILITLEKKGRKESEVAQSCPTLGDPMDCSLHQDSPSMRLSRQEYWSGLPFPSPEILSSLSLLWTDCLLSFSTTLAFSILLHLYTLHSTSSSFLPSEHKALDFSLSCGQLQSSPNGSLCHHFLLLPGLIPHGFQNQHPTTQF